MENLIKERVFEMKYYGNDGTIHDTVFKAHIHDFLNWIKKKKPNQEIKQEPKPIQEDTNTEIIQEDTPSEEHPKDDSNIEQTPPCETVEYPSTEEFVREATAGVTTDLMNLLKVLENNPQVLEMLKDPEGIIPISAEIVMGAIRSNPALLRDEDRATEVITEILRTSLHLND